MANNEYVNRVDYGNDTLIDISDTTAVANDVLEGETFYLKSGAPTTGTLGEATTSTHGLMSAADKTKLDSLNGTSCSEFEIDIATTDWSSSPYTYTWTNSAVTTTCSIIASFKEDPRAIFNGNLDYSIGTGCLVFSASAMPMGTLKIIVQIMDGYAAEIEAVTSTVPTTEDTDASADLDVTDTSGHVLLRLANGHVQTKNFNSANVIGVKPTDATEGDLDISDDQGNVILRLKDGNIFTKNFNSTDPYKAPPYYTDMLKSSTDFINSTMRATDMCDAFVFFTDTHWHLNAGNSPAILKYIKEHTMIDKFFFGGDLCDFIDGEGQPFDAFMKFYQAIQIPIYTTLGNHDYMSSYGTEGRLYTTFNSIGRDRVGNLARGYYYIDNPQIKIRYVFLNGFKPGNNTWDWGFEQTQLDWLSNTALNVESGWGIVILTHMTHGIDNAVVTASSHFTPVIEILDAYSGNGEIICIISGHTHCDWGDETPVKKIPIFVSTCDKNGPWIYNNVDQEPWLSDRVTGTVKEQAINVFVIDRGNTQIKWIRIGCPIRLGIDPTDWTEYYNLTIPYGE